MTGKTATVQYKPVTTLADNKSALAHWSHVAMIKYHMQYPVFMACTGTAVISLTSYPYIVWTWVSYQAVSPTNGLGTRLADRCVCVSLLPDVVTPEEHQNDCSYVYQFSSPTFVSLVQQPYFCFITENWGVGACAEMGTCLWQYGSYLLQCLQHLIHSQSISQSRGSRIFNCTPSKTVNESLQALQSIQMSLSVKLSHSPLAL